MFFLSNNFVCLYFFFIVILVGGIMFSWNLKKEEDVLAFIRFIVLLNVRIRSDGS